MTLVVVTKVSLRVFPVNMPVNHILFEKKYVFSISGNEQYDKASDQIQISYFHEVCGTLSNLD